MNGGIKREKKVIKDKPKHPRPSKDVRWSERKEEKPGRKKSRKREKEIEKEQSLQEIP